MVCGQNSTQKILGEKNKTKQKTQVNLSSSIQSRHHRPVVINLWNEFTTNHAKFVWWSANSKKVLVVQLLVLTRALSPVVGVTFVLSEQLKWVMEIYPHSLEGKDNGNSRNISNSFN